MGKRHHRKIFCCLKDMKKFGGYSQVHPVINKSLIGFCFRYFLALSFSSHALAFCICCNNGDLLMAFDGNISFKDLASRTAATCIKTRYKNILCKDKLNRKRCAVIVVQKVQHAHAHAHTHILPVMMT